MKEQTLTLAQSVVNKINSKLDFTQRLPDSRSEDQNWVVSTSSILICKNPSLEFDLLSKITKALESDPFIYNSIGGWLDPETGLYHVDLNSHFYSEESAKEIAKTHGQKSYYNLATNKVYPTKTKAEIDAIHQRAYDKIWSRVETQKHQLDREYEYLELCDEDSRISRESQLSVIEFCKQEIEVNQYILKLLENEQS